MAVRSHFKEVMSVIITKLRHELAVIKHTFKPRLAGILADRNNVQNKLEQSSIRKIPTVVTAQVSSIKNVNKKMDKQRQFRSISSSTLNREKAFGSQHEKHTIIFFGDSHVRGCASELIRKLR
jgi:hypothetical protein